MELAGCPEPKGYLQSRHTWLRVLVKFLSTVTVQKASQLYMLLISSNSHIPSSNQILCSSPSCQPVSLKLVASLNTPSQGYSNRSPAPGIVSPLESLSHEDSLCLFPPVS